MFESTSARNFVKLESLSAFANDACARTLFPRGERTALFGKDRGRTKWPATDRSPFNTLFTIQCPVHHPPQMTAPGA
jgi:hypothetical protein